MITVVEYDPAWPERFEMLRNEYAPAMAAAMASELPTCVPGPVVAVLHRS